jgi:hypothetical protein
LNGFEQANAFNGLHLVGPAFGAGTVEQSLREGRHDSSPVGCRTTPAALLPCGGVFSRALLINRIPGLDDLGSAAFDRLHARAPN